MMMEEAGQCNDAGGDPLKLAFKRYRAMNYAQFRDCAERAAATKAVRFQVRRPQSSDASLKESIEVLQYPNGFYCLPNPFLPPARPGAADLPTHLAADAVRRWPGRGRPADAGAVDDDLDCERRRTNLDIEPDRPALLFDDAIKFVDEPDDRLFASSWLYKLRWTTLGAQYNWTARRYRVPPAADASWEPPQIPGCLADLAAQLCDLTGAWTGRRYAAQAGIVNYYHPGHSMCFHLDTAEPYMAAPLVSLSVGLSAAYLLAGPDRLCPESLAPIPVLLGHGDVIVMTGQSRQFYHSVVRVFTGTSGRAAGPDYCCFCDEDRSDAESGAAACSQTEQCCLMRRYLRLTRVNINVRQLLRPGQQWQCLRDWTAGEAEKAE
ncbi:hypothetical protein BOX15_Mlig034475g2 [Macrostomum lignano]|uniref:Alpha-ketoglutarate-dependent dioxygenase AlkB-like domain-containing protein n=1 Tax=Macrostomum lignano TaxID=282301 RepID=A0A267GPG8_9PLAT|nr:hypothetical protein BOX15_Mlig034475g2 [Macrostomum lignano]